MPLANDSSSGGPCFADHRALFCIEMQPRVTYSCRQSRVRAARDLEATMADPINLNRARKARAKMEKTATAARNRVVYGQTKTRKAEVILERETAARRLEQKRLEP